jgi:coenzyme PQQ synthesis protein D (PqqD)
MPIRVADDVVFHDLDGEVVLLNLETGVYFGLDPVGSRVWGLIDGRRTADDIVTALTSEYDVDASTCSADVASLLAALRDNGLVDRHGAPAR